MSLKRLHSLYQNAVKECFSEEVKKCSGVESIFQRHGKIFITFSVDIFKRFFFHMNCYFPVKSTMRFLVADEFGFHDFGFFVELLVLLKC